MSRYEQITEQSEVFSDTTSLRTVVDGQKSDSPNRNPFAAIQISRAIPWYLIGLLVYAVAAIILTILAFNAPKVCEGVKYVEADKVLDEYDSPSSSDLIDKTTHSCAGLYVLSTPKSLDVDQLWSAIALAFVLTPAALMIRGLSRELALLHPFRIASQKPVTLAELDDIMDPGFSSLRSVRRYSNRAAFVQLILIIAGTILVPIGTVSITTAYYAPKTTSTGVVGMPTISGIGESLAQQLNDVPYLSGSQRRVIRRQTLYKTQGVEDQGSASPTSTSSEMYSWPTEAPSPDVPDDEAKTELDCFASNTAGLATSALVTQGGSIPTTPDVLGPASTRNITFEKGVQYNNLVTFTWDAKCEDASADIDYEVKGSKMVFTFPEGSTASTDLTEAYVSMVHTGTEEARAAYNLRNNPKKRVALPYGGTVFFATGASIKDTMGGTTPEIKGGVTTDSDNWISRVKCTPQLSWHISNCINAGPSLWANCINLPKSGIALSTEGLDKISGYMTSTAVLLYIQKETDSYTSGIGSFSVPFLSDPKQKSVRAPTTSDYTKFFGVIASSIATTTTAGWYGTAEVETIGRPLKQVYIARIWIIVPVTVTLVLVVVLSFVDLFHTVHKQLPLRKASFLTIASAVRGEWWESIMAGRGVDSQHDMKKSALGKDKVMFGEDKTDSERIVFEPKENVSKILLGNYGFWGSMIFLISSLLSICWKSVW